MEIPQSKAYEIVGQQQVEIVVLREHIGILQQQIAALKADAPKAPVAEETERVPAGRVEAK